MTLWNKRKKKQAQSADTEPEVLYVTEAGDVPDSASTISAATQSPAPASADQFQEHDVLRAEERHAPTAATQPDSGQTLTPANTSKSAEAHTSRRSSASNKKATQKSAKHTASSPSNSIDIENWRKGVKGRPTQVFIGFLANGSKRDAIKYAIGVAERNATSVENAAYAVFPWNDGWAYEVHEGGPFRAYLPAILRFFDAQGEHARLDELVVTITTARRSVRVERTHSGLAGFLLPESFDGEQTEWLEPGPRLKPAVPVRLGVLAAGAAIFGTGFLAMLTALILRPEPPVITATRQDIPYEHLPISTWSALLNVSASGKYIDALQFHQGTYTFSTAGQEVPTTTVPPLPAPVPKE